MFYNSVSMISAVILWLLFASAYAGCRQGQVNQANSGEKAQAADTTERRAAYELLEQYFPPGATTIAPGPHRDEMKAMGDRALPALESVLRHEVDLLDTAALTALMDIGTPAALDVMLTCASGEYRRRGLGVPKAEEQLDKYLQDAALRFIPLFLQASDIPCNHLASSQRMELVVRSALADQDSSRQMLGLNITRAFPDARFADLIVGLQESSNEQVRIAADEVAGALKLDPCAGS